MLGVSRIHSDDLYNHRNIAKGEDTMPDLVSIGIIALAPFVIALFMWRPRAIFIYLMVMAVLLLIIGYSGHAEFKTNMSHPYSFGGVLLFYSLLVGATLGSIIKLFILKMYGLIPVVFGAAIALALLSYYSAEWAFEYGIINLYPPLTGG